MYLDNNNIDFKTFFPAEVGLDTYYIKTALDSFLRWFFIYIGVQMALPFLTDKKSGVMKLNWTNCIPKTSSSRKSVVDCVKATTLQLGARGETK
jgi:hypothetical protein